jgi:hypothetical protein
MKVTPTALRKDLYSLLDRVIDSGETLEIERRGVVLEVRPRRRESRLERLKRNARPVWVGPKEDIFKIDLLEEWRDEWGLEAEEAGPKA